LNVEGFHIANAAEIAEFTDPHARFPVRSHECERGTLMLAPRALELAEKWGLHRISHVQRVDFASSVRAKFGAVPIFRQAQECVRHECMTQALMASPYTLLNASPMASYRVGWAWMVLIIVSTVASASIAV